MTDDDRDRSILRDLAQHPILAEFRKETRARLKALESSMAQLTRMSEDRKGDGERIAALHDRTAGHTERIAAIERLLREEKNQPAHPLHAAWTDMRVLLIGAILIGMALGKAGIDPTSWFR